MNHLLGKGRKLRCGMLAVTALCGCLAVPRLRAQNPVSDAPADGDQPAQSAQPAVPATGENEGDNRNAIILDVNGGLSYTDNIFSDNLNRAAGEMFSGGANLGFSEARPRFDVALNYSPSFLGYSDFSAYDQVNQSLNLRGVYRATPHINFSVQDSTGYFRGIFEASVAEPAQFSQSAQPSTFSLAGLLPGIAPTPNQSVFTPLVDEFTNNSRADITDQLSPNGTLDLFGTLEDLRFGTAADVSQNTNEDLFDTFGGSTGAAYIYGLSRSWVITPSYSYQDLEFGTFSQVAIHSATVNLTWKMTPTLSISVFGGTQHVDLSENVSVAESYLPSASVSGKAVSADGPVAARRNPNPSSGSSSGSSSPWPFSPGPSSPENGGGGTVGGGTIGGGNTGGSGGGSTPTPSSPTSSSSSSSSSTSSSSSSSTSTSTTSSSSATTSAASSGSTTTTGSTLGGLASASTSLTTQPGSGSSGQVTDLVNWYPEYGAFITKNVGHFQFQISGQHVATDGGGVLTSVISTSENAGVRWDVTEHWQARLSINNGSTLALSPVFSNGRIESQDFGFALVHQLTQRLSGQISYDYAQQHVEGDVPFYVDMNRNLVSFSISYRLADFPLGR